MLQPDIATVTFFAVASLSKKARQLNAIPVKQMFDGRFAQREKMHKLVKEHPQYTYTDEKGYLHISDEDASVALIKSIDLYSQRIAIYKIVHCCPVNFKILENLAG